MNIKTKYHGELDINEHQMWNFQSGIPGFPAEHEFALYPLSEGDTFSVLQSTKNENIAFVVASPFPFFPAYDFELETSIISQLDIKEKNDVLPLVILTLGDSMEESTANLQAPVIFNLSNQKAKQVILHDSGYMTKHPLKHTEREG
ncbi:flagellar assembly protein FliW [Bacillus sp. 1P06AnD]|uniref:flagellar assembly protein FliW n=1 Tax=Bacillus sp. 1P06AnD TaxID=3132208 RepID=UPI0039A37EB7